MSFWKHDKSSVQKSSVINVIKHDSSNDNLIWKFPHESFNTNTTLVVNSSQEAIFVKDGQVLAHFFPGVYTLNARNYPFLRSLIGLATDRISNFSCSVFYINKIASLQLCWETDTPISIVDPIYHVLIDFRSHGDLSLQVENGQVLIDKLTREAHIVSQQEIQHFFSSKISAQVRGALSSTMLERRISPIGIDAHLADISAAVVEKIRPIFKPYGIAVTHFTIAAITALELDTIQQKAKNLQDLRTKTDSSTMAQMHAPENHTSIIDERVQQLKQLFQIEAGKPPSARGGIMPGNDEFDIMENTNPQSAAHPLQDSIENCTRNDIDISKVQFSAVAPKRFVKGDYTIVNIVMYEKAFHWVVEELLSEADTPLQEVKSGVHKLRTNSTVRIVLTSPDIEIDDGEEIQEWQGDYLNFSFAVLLPETYEKRQVLFFATVYLNEIVVSKLKFIALCTSPSEQKITISHKSICSAFVSYASEDRQRVATLIQGMKKARPDMDIFFDVESLRSGECWEDMLWKEIDKRDVLFLCWSHSAKASKWVNAEWKYALKRKGVECIEPIPIEPPSLCPPPDELSHKHFNDKLLYIIYSENGNAGS